MQVLIKDLQVHSVAELNPLMNNQEFEGLIASIKSQGQLEPIKIYRGFIIDGRNRVNAITRLGLDSVEAINLPHKTPLKEVRKIAMATELRRHQTKSQLAIKAFQEVQTRAITQKVAALEVGVGVSLVEAAAAIHKLAPMALIPLTEGKKYELSTGARTESLAAILKDLKAVSQANLNRTDSIGNLPPPTDPRIVMILATADTLDTEMYNELTNLLIKGTPKV